MIQQIQKLTQSIHMLPYYQETDRPTLGIVSGSHSSLIIDAGNSFAHAKEFNQQIGELGLPFVKAVVNTHWHWDHWFGNSFYQIPIYVNNYTLQQISKQAQYTWTDIDLDIRVKNGQEIEFCAEHIKKEFPDPNREIEMKIPDQVIKGKTTFDLGGISCVVESVDSDHCLQNLLIFVPECKVLFIGDALYMNLYSNEWKYTIQKLFPFLDKIESFDADILVSSHSNPLTKSEYLGYFNELRIIGKQVQSNNYQNIADNLKKKNFQFNDYTEELIRAFMAGL